MGIVVKVAMRRLVGAIVVVIAGGVDFTRFGIIIMIVLFTIVVIMMVAVIALSCCCPCCLYC